MRNLRARHIATRGIGASLHDGGTRRKGGMRTLQHRAISDILGRIIVALAGVTWFATGCTPRVAPEGWLSTPSELQESAYGAWIEVSLREAVPRTPPPWSALITDPSPRLREAPSRGSPQTELKQGTLITVNAKSLLDSGVWYRIETAEGKVGWVRSGEIVLLETTRGVAGEFIAVDLDTLFVLAGTRLVASPVSRIAGITIDAYASQSQGLAAWTALGLVSTLSHGYYLTLSVPVWIVVGAGATSSENHAPIKTFHGNVEIDDLRLLTRFPQGLPPQLDRSSLKPKHVAE